MSKRKQADASHEPDKRSKPNAKQTYEDLIYEPETPEESLLKRIAELMQHIKARHAINLQLCKDLDRLPECTRFRTVDDVFGKTYKFRWKPREKRFPITYPSSGKHANTIEEHLSTIVAYKPKKCIESLEKLQTFVDDTHVKFGHELQCYSELMSDKIPYALPVAFPNTKNVRISVKGTTSDVILNLALAVLKDSDSPYSTLSWSAASIDRSYYYQRANELFAEKPIPAAFSNVDEFLPYVRKGTSEGGLFIFDMVIYYRALGLCSTNAMHCYALSGEAQGTIFCLSAVPCDHCIMPLNPILAHRNSIHINWHS